jgi:hypothetical protein
VPRGDHALALESRLFLAPNIAERAEACKQITVVDECRWLHQMGYSSLRLLTTPVVNVVATIL